MMSNGWWCVLRWGSEMTTSERFEVGRRSESCDLPGEGRSWMRASCSQKAAGSWYTCQREYHKKKKMGRCEKAWDVSSIKYISESGDSMDPLDHNKVLPLYSSVYALHPGPSNRPLPFREAGMREHTVHVTSGVDYKNDHGSSLSGT